MRPTVPPTPPPPPSRPFRHVARRPWARLAALLAIAVAGVAIVPGALGAPSGPGTSHLAMASPPTAPRGMAPPGQLHGIAGELARLSSRSANGTPPTPMWSDVTAVSSTALPVFEFTSGTWDAADNGVLFYGGDNYATNLNATWLYHGGQWSEIATRYNPGFLSGGSIAYDAADGYSVFYGGTTSFTTFAANNTTYEYSHGAWTAWHLNPSPPIPLTATMAYDPIVGGIIMFGGADPNSTALSLYDQTWLFKGGAWSLLHPRGSPPARWQGQMAWDSELNEMVLYGGVDINGSVLGDTWVLANNSWTYVNASIHGVPPIADGMLAFSTDFGRMLLTCGLDEYGNPNVATWSFDGNSWTLDATAGSPHGHDAAVGVWDPIDREFVVAGGGGYGNPSFTDVLTLPLRTGNVSVTNETDVGVLTNFTASASGGAGPYTFSWNWGDDSTAVGANVSHVYTRAETYVITITTRAITGATTTWQRGIQVNADPIPKVTLSSPGAEAGVAAKLAASAISGFGPYQFRWQTSDGGVGSGNSFSHTFSTAGTFNVALTTIDAVGGNGTTTFALLVNAAPTVGIAAANPPEAGARTVLQAAVSGGVPPFAFVWSLPGGSTATGPAPSFMFATSGDPTVGVTLTDALGATAATTASISVVPHLSLTMTGPASLPTGSAGIYTAQPSAGAEPYNITWSLPSGAVANGSSTTYSFSGAGTYEIVAHVVDGNGVWANASKNVTVGASSNGLLGSSIGGIPAVAVLALIIVVGAVIAVLAYTMVRRGPRTPDYTDGQP